MTKKNEWVAWTDPMNKKQARLLARVWRSGSYYPSGVRVRPTATKKKRSGQGRKTVGWSLFVRKSDLDRKK